MAEQQPSHCSWCVSIHGDKASQSSSGGSLTQRPEKDITPLPGLLFLAVAH